ncbi:MAG: hypothetical protein FD147_1810 [Chloroflexi bacterium]|nr:MAG: hypothetical protein FD147_1810 [Chloroflexota bacterium]MBA4376384.1 hypothetical protein [Anaerolinea sp.]
MMTVVLIVIVGILFFFVCLILSIPLTKKHLIIDSEKPSDFGLDFEEVRFNSTDGIPLYGWWMPTIGSRRTVIFLHGFAGSMVPDLKYVLSFHNAGYNVLMFDFRAHGRSQGTHSSLGALEVRDALGAIAFAKTKGSDKTGLLGFSMGGRTALMTAALKPGIDAVISDGGPLRLRTAITEDIKRRKLPGFLSPSLAWMILLGASVRLGINLFKHDPIQVAEKLQTLPVYFIHGDKDRYTHLIELETMVRKSGNKAQFWRVSEAGHREIDQFYVDEYIQRVIGFFDNWMYE